MTTTTGTEIPRDEWPNIAKGSRVRIVETSGDEHTVTVSVSEMGVGIFDQNHVYYLDNLASIHLIAPPPDPDADLVEVMARAMPVSAEGWDGLERRTQECFRTYARRALDAYRAVTK